MSYRIVFASNGAAIGDGIRVARVSEGGTKVELLTDARTGRFAEVILKPEMADTFSDSFSNDFS